jgi:trk system potassium uptake protein TrkA
MKQFAIIGLGFFGKRMLEELVDTGCEVLIIDKDAEVIEQYKDKVTASYIADAISEEIINRIVPSSIDAAIVDLGDNLEVSILVTNYLKKLGVRRILAKAESDQHAEILHPFQLHADLTRFRHCGDQGSGKIPGQDPH